MCAQVTRGQPPRGGAMLGDQHLERIGPELARMPTVRLCAAVTGDTANLLVGHWLRSHHAAATVEADAARRFPELRLVQRSLVLRTVKRSGRLLDR